MFPFILALLLIVAVGAAVLAVVALPHVAYGSPVLTPRGREVADSALRPLRSLVRPRRSPEDLAAEAAAGENGSRDVREDAASPERLSDELPSDELLRDAVGRDEVRSEVRDEAPDEAPVGDGATV